MKRNFQTIRLQTLVGLAITWIAGMAIGSKAVAAPEYDILTDEHIDVGISLRAGIWGSTLHSDSGDFAPDSTLLFDGPVGTTSFERPPGSEWDFLGVAPEQPIFIWPQFQLGQRTYLGFGAENGSIPLGALQSYFEPDLRVQSTGEWVKISLVDLRFTPDPTDTATNPAHFSLWQTDFGDTTVWMSSFDGIGSSDATWLLNGGHSHYNWGFTRRGYYQVDIRFSGRLNDGMQTFTQSPIFTYHFGVEYQPVTIPEPATGALLVVCASILAATSRWGRRAMRDGRASEC